MVYYIVLHDFYIRLMCPLVTRNVGISENKRRKNPFTKLYTTEDHIFMFLCFYFFFLQNVSQGH